VVLGFYVPGTTTVAALTRRCSRPISKNGYLGLADRNIVSIRIPAAIVRTIDGSSPNVRCAILVLEPYRLGD
jgi:hypothetical protein